MAYRHSHDCVLCEGYRGIGLPLLDYQFFVICLSYDII